HDLFHTHLHYPISLSYLSNYSDAPRFHPSFPTRRSSDLARVGEAPRRQLDLERVERTRHALGRVGRRRHDSRPMRANLRVRAAGDRKSTRLNSSHVSISYAVFCLKKKTKQARSQAST